MQLKLETIISRLLEEHGGGEPYFDNFDALMRRGENLDIVLELLDVSGNIVASGRFGTHLLELQKSGVLRLAGDFILVSGGLRKAARPEIQFARGSLRGPFTFIDDSYYSGTTERGVTSLLTSFGAEVSKTRVVYDGSPVKAPQVESLFRYYDKYPATIDG